MFFSKTRFRRCFSRTFFFIFCEHSSGKLYADDVRRTLLPHATLSNQSLCPCIITYQRKIFHLNKICPNTIDHSLLIFFPCIFPLPLPVILPLIFYLIFFFLHIAFFSLIIFFFFSSAILASSPRRSLAPS